jgi:hypothetical protein
MSTNQFRRYLDLLNEADPELSNPTQPSSEPRCAVCGTPQSQHQALKHQFVAGGAADRPAPVAQGGSTGGGNVGRIKKLQVELKAAGAELGATGANRDGIDGDIGPLTTAAMAKYPDIAAKYPDLSIAQAATPAVDTSKLNAALSAIESIVAKYKGKTKVSESRIYEVDRQLTPTEYQARIAQRIPPDLDAQETPGFQQSKIQKGSYVPPAAAPASAAAQPSVYDQFNKPSGAPIAPAKAVELKPSSWVSKAGQQILSKLPGLGARTAARAGATALSGPLAPFVGVAGAAYTVWDIGNMLYDAYKDSDNLEGMNDADQAVIKQNLAVVNSFMKDPKVADTLPQDIKTRVTKVYLDLEKLAVDTGYSTPAVTQQAATPAVTQQAATPTVTQQAATPATTPAAKANAAVPAVNTFVADLDKLLKKNNFESREYKTLSEQLARDRDIVNEGPSAWVAKNVIVPTAKFAWDKAIKPTGQGIVNNIIAPAAKLATQAAMIGGIGYLAWDQLTKAIAPKAMSAADKAEFDRIIANYKKAVPDQATFDALPKPVQDKLIDLADRLVKMEKAQPKGNK